MEGQWPLVGRAGELRHVQELLSEGSSQGLVLAGRSGAGKTRLSIECLRLASEAGMTTARVTATPSTTALPLGALAPLLPASHHGAAQMVDDRSNLLRRSAAALVEGTGDRHLALLVDDAHLLDETSATLLYQLAATRAAFVMATVRTGEAAPDPVVALWKDGLAERLDVPGLQAPAIGELLTVVLQGPVDPAAVTRLAVQCVGNVLFLRELVLGALEDGTLRDDGGIWRLVGQFSPSDRLVELIETRLHGLDDGDRALLEVVSSGEPLGLAELTQFVDPAQVEALERKALLSSQRNGRRLEIRLAHGIYREVLRARIPAIRISAIAESLAEVVEASGARRREDTLRVATWRLDAGGGSPDLMLAAATTARWRYDFPLAERLARSAVASGAGFDAKLLATQVAWRQGRTVAAEQELLALADEAVGDSQQGEVAVARVDNAIFGGRMEEALQIADQAAAVLVDPSWRDVLEAKRSSLLVGTRGPRVGAGAAEPLLERAQGRALVWACLAASYGLGRLGRLEAAVAASAQGYAAHVALSEPIEFYPWIHLFFQCDALANAGRFKEADALATEQYERALGERSPEAQSFFALQLARTVGDRGHGQAAISHAREAVALFRQHGQWQMLHYGLGQLAWALALHRQVTEAQQALAALDELHLPPALYYAADLLKARAWVAAAAGDLHDARRLLQEASAIGDATGDLIGEAAALHALARLGYAGEVAARLAELATQVEGELVRARSQHAEGLAQRDPDRLETVSADFEAMGADLLAAEAAADAALQWRGCGKIQRAKSAERRAGVLASRCEGATTPSLQTTETRMRLTATERAVSMLAGAGRSNKDIASQLEVSVRTVESHLQHVYTKLGVSSRTELAAALESENLAE